jgi:hypothetical protein
MKSSFIIYCLDEVFQRLVQRQADEALAQLLLQHRLALEQARVLFGQRREALLPRLVEQILRAVF